MSELSENFNKISAQDGLKTIEREAKLLDRDKQEIFTEFQKGGLQSGARLDADMKIQQAGRTAANANVIAGGPSSLELGTQRLHRPVFEADVKAMMERAEHEGTTLDQLTPHTLTEDYIKRGHALTLAYETRQREEHAERHLEDARKLMDNLLGLELPESTHDHRKGLGEDRSITDPFNRAARGS